jgi:O-antigen ligase
VIRTRRRYHESIALPVAGACAAVLIATTGIWFVARESILRRTTDTQRQVTTMLADKSIGGRADLYTDTWHMARAKPFFGWGMASYPRVFSFLFNTQKSVDGLPVHFNDAHSDWLQALAEHGFVGSLLLVSLVLLPVIHVRRQISGAVPRYLLLGCGIIAVYALVEFPFGNFAVVLCWWTLFFAMVQYVRLKPSESVPA